MISGSSSLDRPDDASGKIGAVVLNFRNWPNAAETVRSLQRQRPCPRIVVVDNCSGDGSAEAIRAEFPNLTVIESPVNGGYAAGMNLGIRHLDVEATLLVTHEVLLAPGAIAALTARLKGNVGAVGPLLFYRSHPETVFSAGGFLRRSNFKFFHAKAVPPQAHEVEWLDGSCMLIRRDVGLLDEDFFMYFEDADLCFAMRKNGWKVMCEPTARAWSQPSPPPTSLFARNELRFLARHEGLPAVLRGTWRIAKDAVAAARGRNLRKCRDLMVGIAAFAAHVPTRWLH